MTTWVKKQGGIDRRRASLIGCACAMMLLIGTTCPSPAQGISTARPIIRLEQVVAMLTAAEMPLEGAEVRMTAQIVATIAEPMLELRGLEPWGVGGARARVACVQHEQCLPFYVAVQWADAAIARAALSSGPTRNRSLPGAHPGLAAGSRITAAGGTLSPPTQKSERVSALPVIESGGAPSTIPESGSVHPGTHATLLIEGQRLHIKLPVICLEKGAPGRTIRVTALDHKQTYLAEVVDSTLLKGTF